MTGRSTDSGDGAPVTVGGPDGVGGGPLMVSGGGSTKVATGELFAESAVLRRAVTDADDWLVQLGTISRLQPVSSTGWSYLNGGAELTAASAAIRELRDRAADLAAALDVVAENYGAAERDVQRLFRSLGADVGWLIGVTSYLWLPLLAGPVIAASAISGLIASMITGRPVSDLPDEAVQWIADHPEIYTDPAFVELVAVAVASADDTVAGRLGVPHWLTRLMGDDQLALFGASTSAAGLSLLLAPAGVGRRTPIVVTPVGAPKPVQPPQDYEDAIGRIPPSVPGIPQIRIEEYPGPDGPAFFVYVGGTVDWSLIPGDEPFDMSSNLQGVGQLAPGSREAVEKAMRDAGIRPGDSVQAFGHSQGGLLVAQIAASEKFGIDGVTTFGAPSGQVPVSVSTLAFENTDDAVVATGGRSQQPSPDRLVVGHQAYLDKEIPKGEGMPAHQIPAYTDTAGLADASEDPRVLAKKAATFDLGLGPGTAVDWRADRVEPRPAGGGGGGGGN
ncbi:hypothetical protein D6T64_16710 [Cryobacterium melibiosiphilum]|uniref:Alpha/beta hydrolase n=1 Tax=Cryobacterium melibiosiphilum TaxID=995039 RepID=A0A3A5MJT2_9MICO|nr:hypothetical protein [Cryobacterium melibiosiphilum]RJT87073.1 hypothetical protein D6T64_16710 [Cryobacterium melibiosiphilum]